MKDIEIRFDDICNFFDKQKEATDIADKNKYVLYGGSVGGGKSRWLRWYPLRYLLIQYSLTQIEGIRAGLFCEDYPALHDRHIARIQWEFPEWLGNYNRTSKEFILNKQWGSGVLSLRNLDDVSHYQSAEFALVAVDELTKNKKETFDFLRSRMRWPGIKDVRFIAGSNPGGIGHFWVKQLWMDKVYEPGEKEQDQFKFVPSKVIDNPYLDKSYTIALEGLPDNLKKAFLDGNWDVFQGQFFTEWNKEIHIIPAFEIPKDWKRYRAIDHGGDISPTSCLWFAVDFDKRVYCYREYHAIDKLATNHARKIKELTVEEKITDTFADPSMWIKSSTDGRSVFDLYESEGIYLAKANNDRLNGWSVVREFLAKKEGMERPRLQIFENCYNLIRTIPLQIHDEKKAEDLNCFIAGTKVLTINGEKNIESIQEGDYVITPIGKRKVIKAGVSGISQVMTIKLSNNRELTGTANHKIFIQDKGLIPLSDVKVGAILQLRISIYFKILWQIKKLFIKVLNIENIINKSIIVLMGHILKKVLHNYIGKFISMKLGKLLKDIIFIIKIIIQKIIKLIILLPYQKLNTFYYTVICRQKKYKINYDNGENLKKVKKLYKIMPEKCTREHQKENYRAEIVELLLKQNIKQKYIAIIVINIKDYIKKIAEYVDKYFGRRRMEAEQQEPVRISAVGKLDEKEQRVYNLTVEEAHLYFAEGILVTNTDGDDHDVDALRYFLASWFGFPRRKEKEILPGTFEWEMLQIKKYKEAKEYE